MSKFPYPKNPAPTEAPLIEPIKQRWSPIAFSSDPIEPEKIKTLFEAARWTESSRNEQPWRLIYATQDDQEDFVRLLSILSEDNQTWAKNAYLLMMACALPKHEYKDKPNWTHQYDTGAAVHALFLQAVEMDLIGHQMEGFDKEKAHSVLGVPAEVMPMTMMAIGYPGDESKVDSETLEKRKTNSRKRKEISEIVFKGKWGNK